MALYIAALLLMIGVPEVREQVRQPVPVRVDYDTAIVIQDNLGLITPEEEDTLTETFEEFLEASGITPAVLTVSNEEWEEDYYSLEDYAYDWYVNSFDDEKHWLIVYSQQAEVEEGDFVDWYWEGMQGDDTDDVLTSSVTSTVYSRLCSGNLTDSSNDLGTALELSFDAIMPDLMEPHPDKGLLMSGIVIVTAAGVMIVCCIFLDCPAHKKCAARSTWTWRYRTVPANTAAPDSCTGWKETARTAVLRSRVGNWISEKNKKDSAGERKKKMKQMKKNK